MSETNLTPALEDYLEAIHVLQDIKENVRVMDIAEHLGVSMASVTGSMKKLAEMKYVVYEKRRRVRLTPEGQKIALAVHRCHGELFSFYHDILGADADKAEQSACKVEHVLDPSIIERIVRLSRWLRSLPEGHIKSFREEVRQCGIEKAAGRTMTLDGLLPGEKARVKKISTRGSIGRRIMDMGIIKGAEVEVVRTAPLGDPIDIRVRGYHLSLRKAEAARIEVEC